MLGFMHKEIKKTGFLYGFHKLLLKCVLSHFSEISQFGTVQKWTQHIMSKWLKHIQNAFDIKFRIHFQLG